jgi:hypothetical protein
MSLLLSLLSPALTRDILDHPRRRSEPPRPRGKWQSDEKLKSSELMLKCSEQTLSSEQTISSSQTLSSSQTPPSNEPPLPRGKVSDEALKSYSRTSSGSLSGGRSPADGAPRNRSFDVSFGPGSWAGKRSPAAGRNEAFASPGSGGRQTRALGGSAGKASRKLSGGRSLGAMRESEEVYVKVPEKGDWRKSLMDASWGEGGE